MRQTVDQRDSVANQPDAGNKVNEPLQQEHLQVGMPRDIRKGGWDIIAEEVECPEHFVLHIEKDHPDDAQHDNERHCLVLQQAHRHKRQPQHEQQRRQGNGQDIKEIREHPERRIRQCQVEKRRNQQHNHVQHQEHLYDAPGLADDVIGIAHRAHVNHFRRVQFLVPFQEGTRQENDDDGLCDAVIHIGKERHLRSHRPLGPLYSVRIEERCQVPQRDACDKQQRQDGEYTEQPPPLQQFHFITRDSMDIVQVHLLLIK